MSDVVASCPSLLERRPNRKRAAAALRRTGLHLAGVAALVFVLVASDAFGSGDLSVGRRLLMFGVISGLLVLQASALAGAALRWRGASWLRTVAAVILALGANLALMTVEIHVLKATPVVPYAPDPLADFALFLAPFVTPVSALVLGLKWSDPSTSRTASSPSPGVATEPTPSESLPPSAVDDAADWPRAPVLRVRAEDHYLRLWTEGGAMLVRGRMQEAVRRLQAKPGLRPHRSWWVALSEIERIERRGRDSALLLRDGGRIPVARSRVNEVKRALHNRKA